MNKEAKEVLTFKPKQAVKTLLGGLSERAGKIVRLRFGLDENEGMTLEAIAPIDLPFSDIRRNLVIIKVIGRSA